MSIRAFVGVQLSIAATRQLTEAADAQRKMVDGTGAKVAWVPPKNLHVTLKFIGSVAEELLEGVVVAVGKAAASVAPVRVGVKSFGAFPTEGQAYILWAGVGSGLAPLQEAIERELEAIGFPREARSFHAHITLGRVREFSNDGAGDAVKRAWEKELAIAESPVDAVVVFESRTLPTGVAYIERARLPIGKPRSSNDQVLRARDEAARANQ